MEYQEIKIGGETIKLYNSFKPERLEEETYQEYKYRRQAIANYIKSKDKNFKHVATMLLPELDEKGELVLTNGKPNWTGKTKGNSYVKNEVKEEHMGIVEHLKQIANERKNTEEHS